MPAPLLSMPHRLILLEALIYIAAIMRSDRAGPGLVADKIGVEAASGKVTNTLVFAGSCGLVLGQRAANHTPPGVRFYFRSSLSLKT